MEIDLIKNTSNKAGALRGAATWLAHGLAIEESTIGWKDRQALKSNATEIRSLQLFVKQIDYPLRYLGSCLIRLPILDLQLRIMMI